MFARTWRRHGLLQHLSPRHAPNVYSRRNTTTNMHTKPPLRRSPKRVALGESVDRVRAVAEIQSRQRSCGEVHRKRIVKLFARERLGTPWAKYPFAADLPTNIVPTNIALLKLSGKSPIDTRIPSLVDKIVLESNPLKSTMLVGGSGVAASRLFSERGGRPEQFGLLPKTAQATCWRAPRRCAGEGPAGPLDTVIIVRYCYHYYYHHYYYYYHHYHCHCFYCTEADTAKSASKIGTGLTGAQSSREAHISELHGC